MAFKGTRAQALHGWTTADNAAFDFPNADWVLSFWAKIESGENTGGDQQAQYVLSLGDYSGSANAMNVLVYPTDHANADARDRWEVTWDGSAGFIYPTAQTGQDDGIWRLYVLQYNSTAQEMTFRVCPLNGSATTLQTKSSVSDGSLSPTVSPAIAKRWDDNIRNCGFSLAEFSLALGTLSDVQVEDLASGKAITEYFTGANLSWYSEFRTVGASGDYTDDEAGFTWTRNGTITEITHPWTVGTVVQAKTATVSVAAQKATVQYVEGVLWYANDTLTYANDLGFYANDLYLPGTTVLAKTASISIAAQQANVVAGASLAFTADEREGENINVAASTITAPSTTTPTVRMVPYLTSTSGGAGNRFWFFMKSYTGAAGKTPTFEVSNKQGGVTAFYDGTWGSLNMVYSQDGKALSDPTKTWEYFDNRSEVPESGAEVLTCSNNTAFTGDEVYVAYARPVQWSLLDSHLSGAWTASGYVQELASSIAHGGETHQIGTVASVADINGRTLPEQKQRAFEFSDWANNPDSGQPKLKMLFISGMHSPEDMGTETWAKALTLLTTADSGGTADQQAYARVLKNYRLWCSAWVTPGRYYHHDRGLVLVGGDPDPNRAWDDTGLSFVNTIRTAFESDYGSAVDVGVDCHTQGTPDNAVYIQDAAFTQTAESVQYRTYVLNRITGSAATSNWIGSTQEHSATAYGARVSVTFEQGEQVGEQAESVVEADARALLLALDDIYALLAGTTVQAKTATIAIAAQKANVLAPGSAVAAKTASIQIAAQKATVVSGTLVQAKTAAVTLAAQKTTVTGAAATQVFAKTAVIQIFGRKATVNYNVTVWTERDPVTGDWTEIEAA